MTTPAECGAIHFGVVCSVRRNRVCWRGTRFVWDYGGVLGNRQNASRAMPENSPLLQTLKLYRHVFSATMST